MNDRHPGDIVLEPLLKRLEGVYNASLEAVERILAAFLLPLLKGLEPQQDETRADHRVRVARAFSGARWMIARRKIANACHLANKTSTEHINDVLIDAFVAGLNESAYSMALTGVNVLPITTAAAEKLVADGVIELQTRRMKRGEDVLYCERRAQSAANAAALLGIKGAKLAGHIAKSIVNARQNEMDAAARAYVYSASDEGAYFAGLEAEHAGLNVEKTWLAIMDSRVRPSHSRLHGTTVPIDGLFHGDYGTLRFPHDPEAPPAELYRCRCRMVVHLAGKYPGEYSHELLPSQTAEYMKWRDRKIRQSGTAVELAKHHRQAIKGR